MVLKLLNLIVLILSIIISGTIIYYDTLPLNYLIILLAVLITIYIIFALLIKQNDKKVIVAISLYIFILLSAIFYLFNSLTFLNNILSDNKIIETYHVYAKQDSKHENIDNIKEINYYEDDSVDKAIKKIDKDIKFNKEKEIKPLIDKTEDDSVILINKNLYNIYNEALNSDLNLKVIHTIKVISLNNNTFKKINVKNDPFFVYISADDNYGNINNQTRSDVNIIALVNPAKEKILLLNTPRDTYLNLPSKDSFDKLTHAGIYGINESASALNELYNININYYVKINFTSFIKIIDEIGPIKVNSNYNFSYDGYTYQKGSNLLNGKKALAFSRGRKMLPEGDITRGENQQEVIKGMIRSLKSPKTASKYLSILKQVEKGLITNMDAKTISKLVNMQLKNKYNWEIETINIKGVSASRETYTAGSLPLSVVIPNKEDIANAKLLIEKYR